MEPEQAADTASQLTPLTVGTDPNPTSLHDTPEYREQRGAEPQRWADITAASNWIRQAAAAAALRELAGESNDPVDRESRMCITLLVRELGPALEWPGEAQPGETLRPERDWVVFDAAPEMNLGSWVQRARSTTRKPTITPNTIGQLRQPQRTSGNRPEAALSTHEQLRELERRSLLDQAPNSAEYLIAASWAQAISEQGGAQPPTDQALGPKSHHLLSLRRCSAEWRGANRLGIEALIRASLSKASQDWTWQTVSADLPST